MFDDIETAFEFRAWRKRNPQFGLVEARKRFCEETGATFDVHRKVDFGTALSGLNQALGS